MKIEEVSEALVVAKISNKNVFLISDSIRFRLIKILKFPENLVHVERLPSRSIKVVWVGIFDKMYIE